MVEVTVLQIFRSPKEASFISHDATIPSKMQRNIAISKNSNSARLCPSMDLIMITDTTATSSSPCTVKILNTIDRREVATLQLVGGNPTDTDVISALTLRFAWSPDGQSVAVVIHNNNHRDGYTAPSRSEEYFSPTAASCRVSLFHVLSAHGSEPLEPYHTFHTSGIVQNITWRMAGKDPTTWTYTQEEEEQQIAWRTQLRYADQSSKFLPQGAYSMNAHGQYNSVATDEYGEAHPSAMMYSLDEDISTIIPKAQNALTILCLTKENTCDLYLNGRSLLGTIKLHRPGDAYTTLSTVSSHDMTYWLSVSSINMSKLKVSIAHLPWIRDEKPTLQLVSSSMASIQQSLRTLEQSVVADDWKTSLKRLDQILQMMVDELKKYGLEVTVGRSDGIQVQAHSSSQSSLDLADIIKEYITTGSTGDGLTDEEYSNVANAMDTFFTKGQMHDRLLERLDESLQSALANVESNVEKSLIRPTQALLLQLGELKCLELRDQQLIHDLIEASRNLWHSVTLLQKRMIYSRSAIREFCQWMRSARALVQSKGTTANPNLKKRRVKPEVISRVVSALSQKDMNAGVRTDEEAVVQGGLTESLLTLRVTELLKGTERDVTMDNELRVCAPTSRVKPSVERVKKLFDTFYARPFVDVPEMVSSHELVLTTETNNGKFALHTRIGGDSAFASDVELWTDVDDVDSSKCYTPIIHSKSECLERKLNPHIDLKCCRQWAILASSDEKKVKVYSIPLSREGIHVAIPYVLTAELRLPSDLTVSSLGFYGQDGKSTLSSGVDGGGGQEGFQYLAILCERTDSCSLEILLVTYDSLGWHACIPEEVGATEDKFECCYEMSIRGAVNNSISANTIIVNQMTTPSNVSADYYMLNFSPTRNTAMISAVTTNESIITHTVVELTNNEDEGEERAQEEDDDMRSDT